MLSRRGRRSDLTTWARTRCKSPAMGFQLFAQRKAEPRFLLRLARGRWAGDHPVELVERGKASRVDGSAEELRSLQGEWRHEGTEIYVRGKRVEERRGKERRFFNLVLKSKARGPEGKAKRHQLPPLKGPKVKGKAKGKGKGPSNCVGHWILMHHTPKILMRERQCLLWWHPAEQVAWTRGGEVLETCRVRHLDGHMELLERHAQDPKGTWRTLKGVTVELHQP